MTYGGNRIVLHGEAGMEKIISGINKLADAVAVTMGPKGKNVIIQPEAGGPFITKDGVTVARQFVCNDPIEEVGAKLVKEAAARTVDVAGDGTTTATVLTRSIVTKLASCLKRNDFDHDEMQQAAMVMQKEVLKELDKMTIPVDHDYNKIRDVAIISTNNDEKFGTLIADAFKTAEYTGSILAEAIPGGADGIRKVSGINFNNGAATPAFFSPGESKITFEKTAIMLIDDKIDNFDKNNIEIINFFLKEKRPLLLLARDFTPEFLANIVSLKNNGMRICLVKIPKLSKYGIAQDEWIDDLSIVIGATPIGSRSGLTLKDVKLENLGYAEAVEIEKYSTAIVKPNKSKESIEYKISEYEKVLTSSAYNDTIKSDVKDRISFLNSKSVIITIGYTTDLELREKGDRFDDAICAVRAAMSEGVVIGGGFALYSAMLQVIDRLDLLVDEYNISNIAATDYLYALIAPLEQILKNAKCDFNEIESEYTNEVWNGKDYKTFGFDSKKKQFCNMIESGIIDPKKVTRVALENATSIAILLLTTEVVIAEDPGNGAGWQPPGDWKLPSANKSFNHKK